MHFPILVPTNLRPSIAGPTVSMWRPGSPQLENGQPAIGKRSFEPGIRAFSFKQIILAALFDVTLVFCFEKKGVLRDENDDDSVIPQITPAQFKQYVADGVIQGGMIPKLENSFEALNAGVTEVVITLASAINENSGTRIKK